MSISPVNHAQTERLRLLRRRCAPSWAGNENMEQKYAYIFGKKAKTDDYYRFWLSLSTEKVGKNGKGTGEYLKATLPVRMSKDATETWEEFATKTKNKDIKLGISHIRSGWLKVVEGPEDPYIVLFVNDLCEQESEDE